MSKGRTARLKCKPGYQLLGEKYATCLRGHWDTIPLCVKTGCDPLPLLNNGQMVESYRGAVLKLYCNPGYTLSGSSFIYCDGTSWNDTVPMCIATERTAQSWCDFEAPDLCGWTQDPHHNFDWSRQNFRTPSGNVGTGPSSDHTLGPDKDGYYMFIESSSPRMENDTARLYSPVFPSQLSTGLPACFIFWYHMYGATTGSLNIYIKHENSEFGSGISPKFMKSGDQGNRWIQGIVMLSTTLEPFQVIIEAVRGDGYISDIAIDDVRIGNGSDCLIPKRDLPMPTETDEQNGGTNDIIEHSQSCKLRCSRTNGYGTTVETPIYTDCDCDVGCLQTASCCSDYTTYCMMVDAVSNPTMADKVTRTMTANRTYPTPPPLPPLPPFPFEETSVTPTDSNSETIKFEKKDEIPLIHFRPIRPPWAIINSSTTEESNRRIPIPTEPTPLILNPYTITKKVFVKNVTQVPVYITTTKPTTKIQVSTMPTTKIVFIIPKRPKVIAPEAIPTETTLKSTSKTTPIIMKQNPLITVKTSTVSQKIPKFYPTKKPMTVPLQPNTTTKMTTKTTTLTTTQTTTSTAATTRSTVLSRLMQQDSYTRSPILEVTRDQQWIQARRGQKLQKKETPSLSGIIAILVAVSLVIAAIGIAGYFVVRNRKRERMQNRIADDSDVRFLTSDEILDFNLARPAENQNDDL